MVLMRTRIYVHSHSLYCPVVPCYRGLLKLDGGAAWVAGLSIFLFIFKQNDH